MPKRRELEAQGGYLPFLRNVLFWRPKELRQYILLVHSVYKLTLLNPECLGMTGLQCLVGLPEGRVHASLVLRLEHVDSDSLLEYIVLLCDAVISRLLFHCYLVGRFDLGVGQESLASG